MVEKIKFILFLLARFAIEIWIQIQIWIKTASGISIKTVSNPPHWTKILKNVDDLNDVNMLSR